MRLNRIFLFIIRAYQYLVSPLMGPACRFYPTCSDYAHQAVERHGLVSGGVIALKRMLKCHPFHPGGVDHVPAHPDNRSL
ncbi:MAG TPA: membrane protein insertion efficiency factor YidD [Deltaproteobacteria bacterium]|nr:membrane protein insertion efficiency factor YidD [Deltaproteobacteria bacterium]